MAPSTEKDTTAPAPYSADDDQPDDSSVDSLDKDLAAAIVPEHAQDIDTATERRVLRKIDLYLIPWMWIGYGFVYYDKVGHCQGRHTQ